MITRIGTVSIYVEDQQKALKFWTEKAGMEVRANHQITEEANWIEVAPKGAQTSMVIYPKSMMSNWREMKSSIIFLCDNIEDTFSRLNANDVKFIEQPKKMSWGTYATFVDADDNKFLLKEG